MKLMSIIRLLPHNLPVILRTRILAELFKATAEAFKTQAPSLDRLNYAERLQAYAQFTRVQAEKALQSNGDLTALKSRLYRNACALGEKVRSWIKADSLEEVMKLGQILYRAIGVEMQGNLRGEVTVSSCYYSQYYSAPVCDLISALDDGLFTGLSGGGRLVFSQRITECQQCCKARLLFTQEACA